MLQYEAFKNKWNKLWPKLCQAQIQLKLVSFLVCQKSTDQKLDQQIQS